MTMAILQTRDEWNARPPEAITRLNWSKVDKFIVHYSGASRTQTVRSIQDFCMDNKGHSDIDYNELVRGNLLYVGRGNNIGSHTLGNNSTSYGVCMIGVDGDATPADFNVIRMRYDYACAMAGRQLRMLGHNQAPGLPAGYTTCPGGQLQAWINKGMPYVEDRKVIDMYFGIVDGQPEMYMGNGVRCRLLVGDSYITTVVPLEARGVPRIVYPTLEALLDGMGPLDTPDTGGVVIDVPTTATLTFPPGTVTLA